MMTEITAKSFYKQLTGSYAGSMTAVIVAAAIVGFCAVFCGTQLGWTHLLSVIFLIGLAFCIGLLVFFIIRTARMKQHPVFQRYGTAPMLAGIIREGLQHPRYIIRSTAGDVPFTTLMTNAFIVSGANLVSYLELRDIRTVQPTFIPKTHTVVIGNPILTVGSLAANYAGDRYLESKGINEQNRFDYLIIEDSAGKKQQYAVRHMDMEAVLDLLHEIAPHIQISTDFRPMY